jgi:hypothetical protein
MLENERFPIELGWTRQPDIVNQEDVLKLSQAISDATSLLTSSKPVHATRHRDLHSGFGFQA